MRVVKIPDDLSGSSSHGQGGVVVRSAVVHSKWRVKSIRVQMSS